MSKKYREVWMWIIVVLSGIAFISIVIYLESSRNKCKPNEQLIQLDKPTVFSSNQVCVSPSKFNKLPNKN